MLEVCCETLTGSAGGIGFSSPGRAEASSSLYRHKRPSPRRQRLCRLTVQ